MPAFAGNLLEPALGLQGDTSRRRVLLLAGGVGFSLTVGLFALAPSFAVMLVALLLLYPASTAFVSLSQASLMDLAPGERERNMARWTLVGSIGLVAGPVPIVLGAGWRPTMLAYGALSFVLVLAARRATIASPSEAPPLARLLRSALHALREREVVRWLAVLELADVMLDVLHGFLALYLVDVADLGSAEAALAVAVWTGAGLIGDALLVAVLGRVSGTRYLRASALAVALVFPAFLLAPEVAPKVGLLALLGVLSAGWYAIPKAGLYSALPGRSGTAVAVGSATGLLAALIPLGLGVLAGYIGLGPTMWVLMLAPVGLLAVLRRR